MASGNTGNTVTVTKELRSIPLKPLFRNRRYLFLMTAQAVSNLGDWLYILALFVLVGFRWHASPILISLMMLALTGPMVILGPFTGLLADKWNRTMLMMVSNLVMAVFVGIIPWLPSRWMLFAMLVFIGIFQSLFSPAESGKLKEIVPDEQMQQAASVNSSIMQLAKIVGPGLSGFLVAAWGSMSAFWLDSISFILSTVLLLFTGFHGVLWNSVSASPVMSNTEREFSMADTDSALQDRTATAPGLTVKSSARARFLEGLRHIRQVRILWVGTLMLTLALFFVQLTDAQIVTLLRLIPRASSGLVGMVMALSGVGGLISAILTAFVKWKSTSRVMSLGSLGIGFGLGASALIVRHVQWLGNLNFYWMTLVVVFAMVVGACAGLIFIPFQAMAQQNTPSHLTGRVFGTIGSLTTGAALLGPALGGVLVTLMGIVPAYLITAVSLLMMGVGGLLLRRWMEWSPPVDSNSNFPSAGF